MGKHPCFSNRNEPIKIKNAIAGNIFFFEKCYINVKDYLRFLGIFNFSKCSINRSITKAMFKLYLRKECKHIFYFLLINLSFNNRYETNKIEICYEKLQTGKKCLILFVLTDV